MDLLYKKSCPCIVTPHIGEMARLCKCSSEDVSANILHTSKMFAEKYYVQCVLKDAVTCIALPNSRVYLNNTGNAGMATAGSGDVLAGIIGGLLALGTSYEHAGALACWIHGTCGDKIKERLSEGYLMAGDLVRELSSFRIGEE
jgi:NAD(P)H-hydrate epimerase